MKKYVVDASVVVKWFIPEIHTDAALNPLNDEPELSEADARDILNALPTVPIQFHSASTLVIPAFEIARALDRTVYDSLYIALAESRSM